MKEIHENNYSTYLLYAYNPFDQLQFFIWYLIKSSSFLHRLFIKKNNHNRKVGQTLFFIVKRENHKLRIITEISNCICSQYYFKQFINLFLWVLMKRRYSNEIHHIIGKFNMWYINSYKQQMEKYVAIIVL